MGGECLEWVWCWNEFVVYSIVKMWGIIGVSNKGWRSVQVLGLASVLPELYIWPPHAVLLAQQDPTHSTASSTHGYIVNEQSNPHHNHPTTSPPFLRRDSPGVNLETLGIHVYPRAQPQHTLLFINTPCLLTQTHQRKTNFPPHRCTSSTHQETRLRIRTSRLANLNLDAEERCVSRVVSCCLVLLQLPRMHLCREMYLFDSSRGILMH